MNRHSRIFSILLCVFLLAVVLTGCTGNAKQVSGAGETQNPTGQVNPEGDGQDPLGEANEEIPPTEEVVAPPKFVSPYNFQYPDAVRGIYVTSHSAGGAKFTELLELVKTTDLNAMVIDIKDDHGYITFPLEESSPYHQYSKKNIGDIHKLMKTLEENQVYPIARIVVFKDSVIAKDKPEWSFLDNGSVWVNNRKESFINPFLKETWEYNVEIAKMAAELGFREIQFDYVRFPEGFENRDDTLKYSLGDYEGKKPEKLIELEEAYKTDIVEYQKQYDQLQAQHQTAQAKLDALLAEQAQAKQAQAGQTQTDVSQTSTSAVDEQVASQQHMVGGLQTQIDKLVKEKPVEPNFTAKDIAVQARVDAITDFVAYAKQELEPYDVDLSVDIFGYTATIPEAPGIGQNFLKISSHVDVICSMIYPSHWGFNYFNIPKPDLEPYRLVKEYVVRESEKLQELDSPPISRPWIQDFTAPWLKAGNYKQYGKQEVEDQIRALNEQGIKEFLLWNASNKYTPGVNYLPIGQ